jgi:hypothetical protein
MRLSRSLAAKTIVRKLFLLLVIGLLATGCATSTIESRSRERGVAYAALSLEWRELVNQGKIKVGMPMDAVYVAWGKPFEILSGELNGGNQTTWRYQGTIYREYRHWTYADYGNVRHGSDSMPRVESDYVPFTYIRAQVIFEKGVVKSWQNIDQPKQ